MCVRELMSGHLGVAREDMIIYYHCTGIRDLLLTNLLNFQSLCFLYLCVTHVYTITQGHREALMLHISAANIKKCIILYARGLPLPLHTQYTYLFTCTKRGVPESETDNILAQRSSSLITDQQKLSHSFDFLSHNSQYSTVTI